MFAWLQTTGLAIATKLGFDSIQAEPLLAYIPDWLRFLLGDSLGKIAELFGRLCNSFVSGFYGIGHSSDLSKAVKLIIFLAIIVIGIY